METTDQEIKGCKNISSEIVMDGLNTNTLAFVKDCSLD